MALRRLTRSTPLLLTGLRIALAPAVVLLALFRPSPAAFGLCLATAFLSDVFDGVLARRLGVATSALRRLDSAADTLFYLAVVFAIWRLHPAVILDRLAPLGVLAALELTRYALDLVKFRREASYHMWSSKLWGILLFAACLSVLGFGFAGVLVSLAIYMGILADLEGIAISLVLAESKSDVATLLHAWRLRRGG